METAYSYTVVERMIRRGELGLSDLEHLLDALVKEEKLTPEEQQTLLELAWEMSTNHKPTS